MTDPLIRLDSSMLSVEPGMQTQTTVRVRNQGSIVEGFRLTVLGQDVSAWAQVHPAELQVYPGQEATAIVVVSPPAGTATRSGSFPFAVHAESVVDAASSAVAEGDVEVGRVFGLQSKLTPVTSSGRWRGKHRIELTNWGNTPVRLQLTASDPDERLAFLLTPDAVDLPVGGTANASLKVKGRHPFLRGSPVRLPFNVIGEPAEPGTRTAARSAADPRRAAMDGALTQRPVLSRAAVVAGVLVVVALAGLIAWAVQGDGGTRSTFAEEGTPAVPVLTATALSSEEIQLNWSAPDTIQLFRLYEVSEDGLQTFNETEYSGALTSFVVQQRTPETVYCFQLEAVRGEFPSGRSVPPICATTDAVTPVTPTATDATTSEPPSDSTTPTSDGSGSSVEPTTTSPSGSTDFLGTNFIAIIDAVPALDADAEQRALDRAAESQALVLSSADYPAMVLVFESGPSSVVQPSYFIYVGPFADQAAARSYCDGRPDTTTQCLLAQPSPDA